MESACGRGMAGSATTLISSVVEGSSPFAYVPIYVFGALAGVPAWTLIAGAGAAYGVGWGFVIASISSALAAAAGFLIARYVLRDRIEKIARRYKIFRALDAAVTKGDWRVVVLVRLSPVMPYMLSNYLFGVTRVRFWPYLLAGWIATVPGTLLYVMMGHGGRRVLSGSASMEPSQWIMLLLGIAASVVLVVYLGRLSREALREEEARV